MNLGPADQVLGYTVVQGQTVSVLKRELAKSVLSRELKGRETLLKNIDELTSNKSVVSRVSGSKGAVVFSIEQGRYVVCTQSNEHSSSEPALLACEPVDLKSDQKHELLIIDNPRAGLQFKWQQ